MKSLSGCQVDSDGSLICGAGRNACIDNLRLADAECAHLACSCKLDLLHVRELLYQVTWPAQQVIKASNAVPHSHLGSCRRGRDAARKGLLTRKKDS